MLQALSLKECGIANEVLWAEQLVQVYCTTPRRLKPKFISDVKVEIDVTW